MLFWNLYSVEDKEIITKTKLNIRSSEILEVYMSNNNVGKQVGNVEQFMIFCQMDGGIVRENFTESLPFTQRIDGGKEASHVDI